MFSSINKLARHLLTSSRSSRPVKAARLGVEALEDRLVLSTVVWDGSVDASGVAYSDANWSSAKNWVGDVAPKAGDDLQFPASALQFKASNDFAANTDFRSISISGNAYTLKGNAIGLTAGIKTSNDTGVNTISMPLTLKADQTFTSGLSGTNLRLSGVTLDTADRALTIAGSGAVEFKNGGSIIGTGSLTKNSAGDLFLLNAVNTYTGVTTVNKGMLYLGATQGNAIAGSLVIGTGTSGTRNVFVNLADSEQINDAARITINATGQLNTNGYVETVGPVTFQGGQVVTGASTGKLILNGDVNTLWAGSTASISGKLSLGSPSTARIFTIADGSSGTDLSISAVIDGSDTVALVKQGTGRMRLSGTNVYAGDTEIKKGTLAISNEDALGLVTAGTTVHNGASLLLEGSSSTTDFASEPLVLNGTGDTLLAGNGALQGAGDASLSWYGKVTLDSPSTIMVNDGTTLSLKGLVTGDGSLVKTGEGVLKLSHNNNYTALTEVRNGVLVANHVHSLGDEDGPNGGTKVTGDGRLQLEGGVTVAAEPLTLDATKGIPSLRSAGSKPNTWTGPITLTSQPKTDPTVEVSAAMGSNLIISGTISGPNMVILAVGADCDDGTVLLTAANTYPGLTRVEDGILAISSTNALGKSSSVANPGTTVNGGATLKLLGGISFDETESLTINGNGLHGIGALYNGSGDNTWAATISLASAASVGASAGTTLTESGEIGGPSGSPLTKVGGGTVVLTNANIYAGKTVVAAGTLALANKAALGKTSKGTTVNSGATLQLQGGIKFNPEPLTLNGAGVGKKAGALRNQDGDNIWRGTITLGSGATITSQASSVLSVHSDILNEGYLLTVNSIGDVDLGGTISGAGGLTKKGGGMLTFSGATPNLYSGATKVTKGTLRLAKATDEVAVTGAGLTISKGAVLVGSGIINTSVTNYGVMSVGGIGADGLLTINGKVTNNGVFNVGGALTAGTVQINGDYVQSSTGKLNIELGGTGSDEFDHLAISGKATLDGTLNVSRLNGYFPSIGDAFAFMTFASSSGNFDHVHGLHIGSGEVLELVLNPMDLSLVTDAV